MSDLSNKRNSTVDLEASGRGEFGQTPHCSLNNAVEVSFDWILNHENSFNGFLAFGREGRRSINLARGGSGGRLPSTLPFFFTIEE